MDMRWPGTEGRRPWHMPLTAAAGDLFLKAAFEDNRVYMALMKQIHMLQGPGALLRPYTLWSMAKHAAKLALPDRPKKPRRLPSEVA